MKNINTCVRYVVFLGALIFFWGSRKSYLAAEHHNAAAPKKKGEVFPAWVPKNTTLGRLWSKSLHQAEKHHPEGKGARPTVHTMKKRPEKQKRKSYSMIL